MCLCSRKYKNNILRRFFQCLQQRIERSRRQHMHLIDNIDLISAFRRTICYLFTDLTDIIHAVIRRRIDLDHIHRCACCDCLTHLAFSARTSVHRMFTVHRFGKYLGNRRLAGTSCSTEQICMADPACPDLIL